MIRNPKISTLDGLDSVHSIQIMESYPWLSKARSMVSMSLEMFSYLVNGTVSQFFAGK